MHIAQIEITNLRSFNGTQSISLARDDGSFPGWIVFAGRNGSGKSTLLKALAASVVGPLAARALAGTFPAWVRRGAKVARTATLLTVDKDRDFYVEKGGTTKEPFWSGLEWTAHDSGPDTLERWLENEHFKRRKAAERGPWADAPSGWFVAGYGPYRHLGPATAEVARVSADPNLSRLINLYNESATLSDAVDWLRGVHLRALEKKTGAAELREGVLQLLGDGLLPDGSTVERVDSEGLWVRRDGFALPLEQVSDGYRTVTALVVDIARRLHASYGTLSLATNRGILICPLPGVVLIDEVDAHMHVEWQQKLGFWLTSHFPAIQFLVTTHSPFICQAANRIIRLPAPGESRLMEHLEQRLFNAIVNGGADDAVMSELFGLEHAHSPAAEQLREQLAALELKLVSGTATKKDKAEHGRIREALPDDIGEEADRKLRMVKQAEQSR
jgi:energy-coupling factor transporter ATP-binding protein EcfA2